MDGGLVDGFDEEFIDVNVRRARGDPDQNFGNIFCGERMGAFVDFLCAGGVAFEANQRELRFGEAGIDRADTNAGAIQFQAQGSGDLKFAGFGGAIGRAAFIGDMPGDGADIDD